jgi:hypothetical protein
VALAWVILFPSETRWLWRYPGLRAKWDASLVEHFPKKIPPSATLKRFCHFPGYLQRGAYIQLRLRLTPERIGELYDEFSRRRTRSYFGGDINSHANGPERMPTTFFRTAEARTGPFPDDYEIMVLDPAIPESADGQNWNHGRSHGVAISRERNEIVYWAERW